MLELWQKGHKAAGCWSETAPSVNPIQSLCVERASQAKACTKEKCTFLWEDQPQKELEDPGEVSVERLELFTIETERRAAFPMHMSMGKRPPSNNAHRTASAEG